MKKMLIIYPFWWGSVRALLKGFMDRTLYSGFAYQYRENSPFWDKLLKGRSTEVITTSDAPVFGLWWQYRNSDLNTVRRATLEFCGFSPVKTRRITRVRFLSPEKRIEEIKKITESIR